MGIIKSKRQKLILSWKRKGHRPLADRGKDHNPKHKVEGKNKGGEHRNGRKSQYKNHNPHDGDEPNEYLSHEEQL